MTKKQVNSLVVGDVIGKTIIDDESYIVNKITKNRIYYMRVRDGYQDYFDKAYLKSEQHYYIKSHFKEV